MYCEKCGTEMKLTDKFCESCGNKNSNMANETNPIEVNPSTGTTPVAGKPTFNIKKLIVPAVVIGIIFVALSMFGGSSDGNKYIDMVKNSYPSRYPKATYGEAFDNYFGDAKWEYGVTDDKEKFVDFTGKVTYYEEVINAHIQFDINDDDTIEFGYNELLDKKGADYSSYDMMMGLYDNAFEEVYIDKGYTLPDHIDIELAGRQLAYGLFDAFTYGDTSNYDITVEMFHELFDPITKSDSVTRTSTTVVANTEATTLAVEDYVDMALAQYAETMQEETAVAENWSGEDYGEFAEYVTIGDAGLYSSMNTSDLIMTIPAGMKVNVTDDCGGGWHYAIYNNKDGFIESNKLNQVDDYEVAIGHGQYILPESSTRAITDTELSALTSEQLRLAINEIYARHGRRFNDSELQMWFDSKDWYNGTIASENFSESVLSQIEKNNISKLSAARNNKGFTPDWIYGTYENDIATAEIGWYSGDDADYIYLQGSYGMYAGEFSGVVISNANNFYVAQDEDGYVLSFEYNGIDRIEVFDDNHNYGMGFPGFTGAYEKTKDLSQYVS